jgi:hypothetical protein
MTDAERETKIRDVLEKWVTSSENEQTGWLNELLFFRFLIDKARVEIARLTVIVEDLQADKDRWRKSTRAAIAAMRKLEAL